MKSNIMKKETINIKKNFIIIYAEYRQYIILKLF